MYPVGSARTRSVLDFATNLVQGPRGHHWAAQCLADGPTYYVFGRNGTVAHMGSGVTWRDSWILAASSENSCELQKDNSSFSSYILIYSILCQYCSDDLGRPGQN